MKFLGLEGTLEEINDFIDIHKLDVDKYFEKKESLHWKWIVFPILLLIAIILALIFFSESNGKVVIFLFVLGIGSATWLVTSVQLKFKIKYVSTLTSIGLLIILLVAAGYLIPGQILETIKSIWK
jgi:hypothetical protein